MNLKEFFFRGGGGGYCNTTFTRAEARQYEHPLLIYILSLYRWKSTTYSSQTMFCAEPPGGSPYTLLSSSMFWIRPHLTGEFGKHPWWIHRQWWCPVQTGASKMWSLPFHEDIPVDDWILQNRCYSITHTAKSYHILTFWIVCWFYC